MNKDDRSFFAAIRKGSSSASGVLLLKADFRIVYKEFLPPTTNFEKRGKEDIKKKFKELVVANNDPKNNLNYNDWDQKTPTSIPYKNMYGDNGWAPRGVLPLITFFKHDRTKPATWPEKIKILFDIMKKQKDFYYRDEEDYK